MKGRSGVIAMRQTIYTNRGVKVVVTGSVSVILPNGKTVEQYSVANVNQAIELADELATKLDEQIAA
jgi:hypothetical protein